eukprot:TRINITY_DN7635_c0_g1_i1.p1 TRINITY_DN7635_c0_g1~~TRINITY_DN7635_c0_g1_i1.p1  ORF type:complete len:173 (-),score=8.53 TRINITY_DN7635_c0_g1_i1:149-622(-)
MEILAPIWGGKAGACWEIWKVEPCCGEPANLADAVYCAACWCIPVVNCFTAGKLYSGSLDQQYGLVNHCVPFIIPYVSIAFATALRHNVRTKYGVGLPIMDPQGLLGDFIMVCCCGCCSGCQTLRASGGKEAWDWIPDLQNKTIQPMVQPCMVCRQP